MLLDSFRISALMTRRAALYAISCIRQKTPHYIFLTLLCSLFVYYVPFIVLLFIETMANCSLACTPNSRPPTAVPNIRDRTPDMCQMSPPSSISSSNQSGIGARIRKKATVTPRTFTRFFTPRSLLESGKTIGASRQALRDITASTVNDKNLTRQASRYKNATTELGNDLSFKDIRIQKRKALDTPETTPERSSPPKKCREGYFSGHSAEIGLLDSLLSDSEDEYNQEQEDSDDEDPEVVESQPIYSLNPLIRSRYHGQLGRVLRGEVNNSPQFSLASRYGYVDSKWTLSSV